MEQASSAVSVSEGADGIEVEIADTGSGISPHRMREVFKFELASKGKRVGMRMGLPVSKRSIEEIGGSLSLESRERGRDDGQGEAPGDGMIHGGDAGSQDPRDQIPS